MTGDITGAATPRPVWKVVGGSVVAFHVVGVTVAMWAGRSISAYPPTTSLVEDVGLMLGFGWFVVVDAINSPLIERVTGIGFLVALNAIPLAIGLGILRYRLYEIDRIISRTISYAVVVSILGGTYATGVVLLGRTLAPLGAGNDVTVAAATLAAAAPSGHCCVESGRSSTAVSIVPATTRSARSRRSSINSGARWTSRSCGGRCSPPWRARWRRSMALSG